jgi:YD repeat-containing protein
MINGVKDQPVDECFTVTNAQGNLISGLDTTTSFTAYIYDPNGNNITSSVNPFFTELGDGNYKLTFTPNVNGIWYVNVTHPEYFPWGKNDDINVNEADLTDVYEIVRRTLGLVHHNMYIDDPTYDEYGNMIGARVRIYDDSVNVGTSTGVIETYKIEADSEACGQFTYWKQVVGL